MQLILSVADTIPLALRTLPENVGNELRLAAAMKLYEVGRLSAGAAAELGGIPKPLFLMRLSEYGVSAFRLTNDELQEEMQNALGYR